MNSSEVERANLMQTSRDWAKPAAIRDEDLIVSFWAEDAIVLAPDQPAVVGKQAIREFVRQSLGMSGFSITWEPEQATVALEGNFGYIIERNRFHISGCGWDPSDTKWQGGDHLEEGLKWPLEMHH